MHPCECNGKTFISVFFSSLAKAKMQIWNEVAMDLQMGIKENELLQMLKWAEHQ